MDNIQQLLAEKQRQNQLIEELLTRDGITAWLDKMAVNGTTEKEVRKKWSDRTNLNFLDFNHYLNCRDEMIATGVQMIAEGLAMMKLPSKLLEETFVQYRDDRNVKNPTILKFVADYEQHLEQSASSQ